MIAERSRGTPRVANRLLKRVRDFAEVRGAGVITEAVAAEALGLLEVDEAGLDRHDRTILETIAVKFSGGPVGLSTLAAAVDEEQETIEDVYEPYLLQQGLLEAHPARPRDHRERVRAPRPSGARGRRDAVLSARPLSAPTPAAAGSSASSSRWICSTTTEPSPTADATRLVEPLRTSPTANTRGMLVSSAIGARSRGQCLGSAPLRTRSGPVCT